MKLPIIIFSLLSSQNSCATFFGEEKDWDFIQSVGGISVGKPELEKHEWLLPVFCNVAGIKKFTVKPTVLYSALVWAETKVQIEEDMVYLSIETTLAGGGKSSICGPAKLGKLEPGRYKAVYRSPDKSTNQIGELEIGL